MMNERPFSMAMSNSPGVGYGGEFSQQAFSHAGDDDDELALGMAGVSGYGMGSGEPSDEALIHEIRNILRGADLMTVTKKQVREQLSVLFGVDMTLRKEFINECINLILQGKL